MSIMLLMCMDKKHKNRDRPQSLSDCSRYKQLSTNTCLILIDLCITREETARRCLILW